MRGEEVRGKRVALFHLEVVGVIIRDGAPKKAEIGSEVAVWIYRATCRPFLIKEAKLTQEGKPARGPPR